MLKWSLVGWMVGVSLAQSTITSTGSGQGQGPASQPELPNMELKCAKLELLDNSFAKQILSFNPTSGSQIPSIIRIYKAPTECSNFILGYQSGQLLLKNDNVISVYNNIIRKKSESLFFDFSFSKNVTINKESISQYFMFDYRFKENKRVNYYLGVIDIAQSSKIVIFDSNLAKVRDLGLSSKNITSICYFPDPDTSGGSLGLTIRDRKETYLVELHWYHPEIYNGTK